MQDELVVLKGRLDSMEIPSAAELDTKISELERQLKKVVEDKNFTAVATVQEITDTLKEERKDVLTSDEIDNLIDAKESELLRKGTKAGLERQKGRQGKVQSQAKKGTKSGKERYKGRQGKAQRQARKGTKAGKERHKGRQGKAQSGYPGGYCGSPGTVGTADGYCRVLWVLRVLCSTRPAVPVGTAGYCGYCGYCTG